MTAQDRDERPREAPTEKNRRNSDQPVLILAGPTGVGKTELAARFAGRGGYELISADSMQIYRGMEIGTGQPTAEELGGIRLHACGLLRPEEPFDVQRFLRLTENIHNDIVDRGARPLYVGGTGMYLRALRWGLADVPAIPRGVRPRLEAEWRADGGAALYLRLGTLDPAIAARIAPGDHVRIVRALEVIEVTGRRFSDVQVQWENPTARFPHRLVVLNCPRTVLVERIERRVDAMMEHGWIDEVRALMRAGYPEGLHAFKALGYREIFALLRGEMNEATARAAIKARTRQFARRQLTWFRKERGAAWIEYDGYDVAQALPALEKELESPEKTP